MPPIGRSTLLLIVQAIVGWIATSAYRAPILVFWLFELPPIWPVDQPFSDKMFWLHRMLGIAIVAAALRPYRGRALSSLRPQGPRADAHDGRLTMRTAPIGDLTFQEIARRLAASSILCLPMGSMEQHGPHLPLNTDPCWPRRSPARIVERWGESHDLWRLPRAADRTVARARLGAWHAVAVGRRR